MKMAWTKLTFFLSWEIDLTLFDLVPEIMTMRCNVFISTVSNIQLLKNRLVHLQLDEKNGSSKRSSTMADER